jgi:hypothetical protein
MHHRYNICNIIFGSFETLNGHDIMEHSEARRSPAGVSQRANPIQYS